MHTYATERTNLQRQLIVVREGRREPLRPRSRAVRLRNRELASFADARRFRVHQGNVNQMLAQEPHL